MVQKVSAPFKEFGLLAGALYSVDRVCQRISSSLRLYAYELMVQPIPDKPLLAPRLMRHFELREIRSGDPELRLMPARPEIRAARFRQNAICMGAFHKGEFIGYIWFCFRAYEEDEVRCTFVLSPEDEAVFDFDLYIFPEHRMGLGFVAIWNAANEFLRARGIKYTFSRLTRFNTASRRAHEHLGWKRVGRAVFVEAWRLQLMLATVFPYFHVSLSESTRARLKLRPDVLS